MRKCVGEVWALTVSRDGCDEGGLVVTALSPPIFCASPGDSVSPSA